MTENEQKPPGPKIFLRNLVPAAWLREREIFLRLGGTAGPTYFRLRARDLVGMRTANQRRVPPGARSFLFVCFGNIMRSPMAEAMFRRAVEQANLPGIRASSAGIHAIPGNTPHPWAVSASQEFGLPLTAHRAQLLTPDLVVQADVIFVMDFQNKAEILTLYPEADARVLMLSAYGSGPMRGREIPDPFHTDLEGTRRCYSVLQSCIDNLAKELLIASRASTEPRTATSSKRLA
jgi:protein-tyrosine-phosphatase